MKRVLEKTKSESKEPYLTMLESRNTPVGNYRSPAELAVGRQLRSFLLVNRNNFNVKTIDDNEFKERRGKDKKKQCKYYDQHTKVRKDLRNGEVVRKLRDAKWIPATVLEKADEPRSYILKTENGRTYRRNRGHILKTGLDEDYIIEISDDDDEEETSEENVTVQSDDTLKDVKWEESGVNDTNKREDTNDRIGPEKITRSGRVSRRPKRYEDYEPF